MAYFDLRPKERIEDLYDRERELSLLSMTFLKPLMVVDYAAEKESDAGSMLET